jgi:hypothetical protein
VIQTLRSNWAKVSRSAGSEPGDHRLVIGQPSRHLVVDDGPAGIRQHQQHHPAVAFGFLPEQEFATQQAVGDLGDGRPAQHGGRHHLTGAQWTGGAGQGAEHGELRPVDAVALEVQIQTLVTDRGDAMHPAQDLHGCGVEVGISLLPLAANAVHDIRGWGTSRRLGHARHGIRTIVHW